MWKHTLREEGDIRKERYIVLCDGGREGSRFMQDHLLVKGDQWCVCLCVHVCVCVCLCGVSVWVSVEGSIVLSTLSVCVIVLVLAYCLEV